MQHGLQGGGKAPEDAERWFWGFSRPPAGPSQQLPGGNPGDTPTAQRARSSYTQEDSSSSWAFLFFQLKITGAKRAVPNAGTELLTFKYSRLEPERDLRSAAQIHQDSARSGTARGGAARTPKAAYALSPEGPEGSGQRW